MIILRRKLFIDPGGQGQGQELTSKDIRDQQFQLQKQQAELQKQRQALLIKEDYQKRRLLAQNQKMENIDRRERDKAQQENVKTERSNGKSDNTDLYKNKTKPVTPVPMKV